MNSITIQTALKNVPLLQKHFKGFYFGIFSTSYLKDLSSNLDFIIMNTSLEGEHWYIIYRHYSKYIVFDSLIKYNITLPRNLKRIFSLNIQNQLYLTCGEQCLSFIYYVHLKKTKKEITYNKYISYLQKIAENKDLAVWKLIYTHQIYQQLRRR